MKKKHEEAENNERWLVSYSDFITLLMVMFVVLYSMGQVDVKKYKQLADSMRAAFSGGGAAKVVDSQINQVGGSTEDGKPNPISIPGIPQKPPESQEVATELTSMLQKMNLGNAVSVQTNIEGVLISLSEKLVFTPGTAVLSKDAYPVLDTIVEMIKATDNQIRVVGHTDNTPPTDPKYSNNWELSAGRAVVIANYMIKKGIAGDRLMVSGKGEYDPVFPNDTPEHRSMNSRADVVIVYKSSTSKPIDVNSSFTGQSSQSTTNQTTTNQTTTGDQSSTTSGGTK
jgi:chemotaxis protein MotB